MKLVEQRIKAGQTESVTPIGKYGLPRRGRAVKVAARGLGEARVVGGAHQALANDLRVVRQAHQRRRKRQRWSADPFPRLVHSRFTSCFSLNLPSQVAWATGSNAAEAVIRAGGRHQSQQPVRGNRNIGGGAFLVEKAPELPLGSDISNGAAGIHRNSMNLVEIGEGVH